MEYKPESLIRLPEVLRRFPVSRAGWYQGVKDGKYPAPAKLGHRTAVWRSADIDALIISTIQASDPSFIEED